MGIFWWIFMLLVSLIIPAVMLVLGRRYEKNPPREISAGSGYRTSRSMKSGDAWEFAQHTFGRVWRKMGSVLLVLTAVVFCFCIRKNFIAVSNWCLLIVGVQLVVALAALPVVEGALKKTFDEYGRRKNSPQ